MLYRGHIGVYRDNGKDNGNYHDIGLYRGHRGFFRDNRKYNGNYSVAFRM